MITNGSSISIGVANTLRSIKDYILCVNLLVKMVKRENVKKVDVDAMWAILFNTYTIFINKITLKKLFTL
jgi:hypothetical protein